MEGFKKLPKMQCFKEGGYVTSKPKSVVEKTTKVAPTGNKKANAKSAAAAPKEKEEKVDITTMKKGGRAKKATGTVKKFVKPSGDKDAIKKVKDTSKKAAAPSKAAVKGKEIKKFADGGLTAGVGGITGDYGPNGQYTPNTAPIGNMTMAYPNTPLPSATPSDVIPLVPNGYTPYNPDNGMIPVQPRPYSPYGQPNYNPVINNSNTMNANVGGEGNTYNPGFGGPNPMQNPGGIEPANVPPMAYNQAAAPAAGGSVNLLPGLFGANK
jgi:hypothetical protein